MKKDDKIIKKLVEHDDQFEEISDKIEGFRKETLVAQEQMITILKRLDEE